LTYELCNGSGILGVPGEHILTGITCSDLKVTLYFEYFWILVCICVAQFL